MAEQTPKLGLSLPAADDFYDVNVTNANFAAIDAHAAAMGDKNAPNGYAGLDEDGKLPDTIAPPMTAGNVTVDAISGLTAANVQEALAALQSGKVSGSRRLLRAKLTPDHPTVEIFNIVSEDAAAWGLPVGHYHVIFLPNAYTNGYGMMMAWNLHWPQQMWICGSNANWGAWSEVGAATLQCTNPVTASASTIQEALTSLFTLASNGKAAIAGAVDAKGVPATAADTFPVLADKIGQIETGVSEYSFSYDGRQLAPFATEGNQLGVSWSAVMDVPYPSGTSQMGTNFYLFVIGATLYIIPLGRIYHTGYAQYYTPNIFKADLLTGYVYPAIPFPGLLWSFMDDDEYLSDSSAGEIGGYIYVLGGHYSWTYSDGDGGGVSGNPQIKRLDLTTNTASVVTTISHFMSGGGKGVALNGRLYFRTTVTAYNGSGYTANGIIYDPVTNTAQTMPADGTNTIFSRAPVVYGDSIYFLASATATHNPGVRRYHPASNSYSAVGASLPYTDGYSGATTTNIFVKGDVLYINNTGPSALPKAISLSTGANVTPTAPAFPFFSGNREIIGATDSHGRTLVLYANPVNSQAWQIAALSIERTYTLLGYVKEGGKFKVSTTSPIALWGSVWYSVANQWHTIATPGYLVAPIGASVSGSVVKI